MSSFPQTASLPISPLDMSYQLIGVAAVAALILIVKLTDSTDIPKIKNLPAIPGVPIFGNLLSLGTDHARVAAKWAEKYGPVFQTRLGNKVSFVQPSFSSSHHA
jgi:phenylacetate 2-hydroxylase